MKNIKVEVTNKPLKGMADWFPEEYIIRKYIFDTWRKVCKSFGYQEYLTPILEDANIYRAKSGGDIGGKELTIINDRSGKELAIRPEMTPSVTRMISRIYTLMPKPFRYFSIANFFRNQRPQKGRNREFWQLNYDIFGSTDIEADIEIIQIGIEIMLAFNPPENSFVTCINDRKIMDYILENKVKLMQDQRKDVVRILDKYTKVTANEFVELLKDVTLTDKQISTLIKYMQCSNTEELLKLFPDVKDIEGYKKLNKIISILKDLGYEKYMKFSPSVVRGLDYYTSMVFEIFDTNPNNPRSLFGGGRYDGLSDIFGVEKFPAVGCAPGDETIRLFLEGWKLIDKIRKEMKQPLYYIPVLSDDLRIDTYKLAMSLRKKGLNVVNGLEIQTVGKALRYANQRSFNKVILYGTDEKFRNVYLLKDLVTGKQKTKKIFFD